MPKPNALVGLISRINPQVTKPGAEMLREFPEGISIELEGERTARLYPGDQTAGLLEILEGLRGLGTPVYLEVDPNTKAITQLLIPLVSKVVDVSENNAEDIEVELERSHARHVLKRANNYFAELLEKLRDARAQGSWQIITETDRHEIIDVRPHTGELPFNKKDRTPLGAARLEWRQSWYCRLWCWCCCLFRCVSPTKAKALFDLCSAQTCDPLTVPAPCIPFLYPDNGCWARAHEMCRLMIAQGAHPRKVWIHGMLHPDTKNHPDCFVYWRWHVAPTLCVRRRLFRRREEVIDPSLCNGPVSEAAWKEVQKDPNATLTPTDVSVYIRPSSTDPTYTQTNFDLDLFRWQLRYRSLLAAGPPPYANCP